MTISTTCDITQLRNHRATLEKRHTALEEEISQLSTSPGARRNNETAIAERKRKKIPLKEQIAEIDALIAKAEAPADEKPAETPPVVEAPPVILVNSWTDFADAISPFPIPEADKETSYLAQITDPRQLSKLGPNGLSHTTSNHEAA